MTSIPSSRYWQVARRAGNWSFPRGYNLRQIADKVEATCGIDAEEFYAQTQKASDYVADYPFLEGVYNDSMEGFLYPDTYPRRSVRHAR